MADLLAAPPVVYALALVPAVLWGFEPVVSKRGMAVGGTPLQAALVVVVVDSALFWTLLAVRRGTDLAVFDPGALSVFVVAGVVGTALGRLAVFAAVRRVGASVTSAGAGVRPLFATLLAAGFLGERVGPTTAVGVAFLVAGLSTFALARGGDVEGWETRELLFPVAASACFAVGNVLRRFGLESFDATVLSAVAVNETAALVVLGAYVLARGRTGRVPGSARAVPYFAASGLLTAVALVALFAALAHPEGRVAVVDPLAATAPLFTPVFAAVLLRDVERVTPGVVAGAVLTVVGAVLVTAGPALFA